MSQATRRWCRLATRIAALVPGTAVPGAAQESITAFVNVDVIPMDQDRLLQDQTVVVRGSRIVAIGPAREVALPAGAVRIDGAGKYLMPGLGDMHFHDDGGSAQGLFGASSDRDSAGNTYVEKYLLVKLANGFTALRNMGGQPASVLLRDRLARGELLGPRLVTAGPLIDNYATSPLPKPSMSFEEARRIVDEVKANHYDFVKLHAWGMPSEVFDTFLATLHREHVEFAGHAPMGEISVERWLAARPLSTEHLYEFRDMDPQRKRMDTTNFWSDSTLVKSVRARAHAVARLGVYSCPTLVYYLWAIKMSGLTQEFLTLRLPYVRALHDAGVPLLLGTDSYAAYTGTPIALEGTRELELLTQAGLTPYETLATATLNIARYFKEQDSAGTVEVGKRADLVLYDKNPLADVRNAVHPAGVMRAGRWLSRADFDAKFAALGIRADWH